MTLIYNPVFFLFPPKPLKELAFPKRTNQNIREQTQKTAGFRYRSVTTPKPGNQNKKPKKAQP